GLCPSRSSFARHSLSPSPIATLLRKSAAPQRRQRITCDFAVSIRSVRVLMTRKAIQTGETMSNGPVEPVRHFRPETQAGVYVRGLSGAKPDIPTNFFALEAKAKEKMSAEAWAYVAGAAGLESTMQANRAAFDRVTIAPHMLAGAGARTLSCEL